MEKEKVNRTVLVVPLEKLESPIQYTTPSLSTFEN